MPRHAESSGHRGFTMIEIMIVVVIAGLMLRIALPYIRVRMAKANITGSLSAITSLHALARTSAIQKGRTAVLVVNHATGTALVILRRTGSATVVDTVGSVVNLTSRWGVTVTTTSDSTVFTPLSIGTGSANNTITVSKGGFSQSLVISAAGRLLR